MQITAAKAKSDFSRGLLTKFLITAVPMGRGWYVSFKDKPSGEFVVLIDAHKKDLRVFKTLDAAVSTLLSIGFEVIEICPS
jgi:hypothetical protein